MQYTPQSPVNTSAMKWVSFTTVARGPAVVSDAGSSEAQVEALRNHVLRLELRLVELESIIGKQNQDVVIRSSGSILIQALGTVEVSGTIAKTNVVSAEFNTPVFRVSGIVTCDTLQTNTVIAASYTPGAGNLW